MLVSCGVPTAVPAEVMSEASKPGLMLRERCTDQTTTGTRSNRSRKPRPCVGGAAIQITNHDHVEGRR